jgi:hypothetical protein
MHPLGACPRPGYVPKHVGVLSPGLYPSPGRLDSFPMTDDGGVLGNLPNSRPGRRSDKRPATPGGAAKRRPPAAAKRAEEAPPADPVGDVIRAATGLASVGARVANGVAREVVRRLPRP